MIAPAARVVGDVRLPGDKSISHRAILLAALGDGLSLVRGLSDGEDVGRTLAAVRALGVRVEAVPDGVLRFDGVGLHGLSPPDGPIDCGNAGTAMRLLLGVLAAQPFETELVGDASLCRRPMGRVTHPLRAMGARVEGPEDGTRAPLLVRGRRPLRPLVFDSPRASAQVKSAILLAGLHAAGRTAVTEPHRSRDHTEQMLLARGVDVRIEGLTVSVAGPVSGLAPRDETVPGDPSSAAFPLCAAALLPGSEVTARGICLSPTRTGFLDALRRMGADVRVDPATGDVTVRGGGGLTGTELAGEQVVRCLDEVPVLAVVATRAAGTTVIRDAAELRVKESDRIATTCELLRRLGARVDERPDGLAVEGDPAARLSPFAFDAPGDHRLVMAAAVAALAADGECEVGPTETPATSWPGFWETLEGLADR